MLHATITGLEKPLQEEPWYFHTSPLSTTMLTSSPSLCQDQHSEVSSNLCCSGYLRRNRNPISMTMRYNQKGPQANDVLKEHTFLICRNYASKSSPVVWYKGSDVGLVYMLL